MSPKRITRSLACIPILLIACSAPLEHAESVATDICACETSECIEEVKRKAHGKFSKADIDALSQAEQDQILAEGARALECTKTIVVQEAAVSEEARSADLADAVCACEDIACIDSAITKSESAASNVPMDSFPQETQDEISNNQTRVSDCKEKLPKTESTATESE